MRNEKLGQIITGLFFIVLGVGFLLDQFKILDFGNVIADWWPIIFVISGVVTIVNNARNWLGGAFMITIGSVLILSNIVELPFNVWNLWPLVLVFVGLSIIFSSTRRTLTAAAGGLVKESAIFWGFERRLTGEFSGASILVMFGGGELDLRNAEIKDGAEINVTCMFGGVEIKLPLEVGAEVTGAGILGGFSNKVFTKSEPKVTVKLTGTAFCGGVEIK